MKSISKVGRSGTQSQLVERRPQEETELMNVVILLLRKSVSIFEIRNTLPVASRLGLVILNYGAVGFLVLLGS